MSIPISFWGSPTLSANLLGSFLADSRFKLAFVVTQPDKPRSKRGQKVEPSPVKKKATENDIPVLTPENLKQTEIQELINRFHVDFHVILAYGKLIPQIIFNNPPRGAINFHASLLPLLRGAAPIEFSLWGAHVTTGWSLQRIVSKLDAGDIVDQVSLDIKWEDHQYSLHQKMEKLLINNANEMLYRFSTGGKEYTNQNKDMVTYCRKIKPADGEIDWKRPSLEIRNQARALGGRPGVFVVQKNKKIKIMFDFPMSKEEVLANKYLQKSPGDLLIKGKELWVVCGDHLALPIKSLKISGKPEIIPIDFINGYMRSGSIINLSS